MAEKNLKISVKSDLRDGQKLVQFVDALHNKVKKFADVLGNLSLGGGAPGPNGKPAPGQQTLAKQLEVDKKAMESMGREVDNLNRRFQNLGNTVQQASGKMSGKSLLVDQYGRPVSSGGGAPGGGGGGLTPPGGAPGAPGGPGGPAGPGGSIWNRPVGGAMGMVGRMVGWGTILNNLKEGFLGAPQRNVDWAMLGGKSAAESSQSMGQMGARLLGNDMGPGMGLMRLAGRGHGNTGFNRGDFEEIINASPERAQNIALQKGLSLNMVKAWNEAGQALTPQARAANMNKLYAGAIQTAEGSDAIQDTRIGYARAQATSRVGFARKFGRDFQSGIPLGNTVDPQQTMATVASVLDVLGTGTNVTKITKLVSEATRMGLSNEAIQTMLRASEIGGGNLMGRMLRSGLSRPMMSAAGTAAAGMASQSLLRLNPETFAGGFTAGGAGTDELTMRKLGAGASFLGQATTGGLDAYQQTVNIALATKKGRSVYTTQALASMPFNELLNAATRGPTAEQKDAGITQQDAKEQLNKVVGSLRNRAVTEAGVAVPAGIQALMGLGEDVAGGIEAAARRGDTGLLRQVSSGLSLITNQPLGASTAEFLGGALTGGKEGAMAKESRGFYGTALESTMAGSKELERDWVAMNQAMRDLSATVKTLPDMVTAFKDSMFAITPEDAAKSALSLAGLGNAMGIIADKGPDAVKVMDHVAKFVERIAAKQEAAEERGRNQIDFKQF